MAFYYVKAGGTATGDAGRSLTARVGSFAAMGASAYYDNLKFIFADDGVNSVTPVVSADDVRVSNLHDHNYAAATVIAITDCSLQSVEDANADQYLAGARERTSLGNLSLTSQVNKSIAISGVSFDTLGGGTAFVSTTNNGPNLLFSNGDLSCDTSSGSFQMDRDASYSFKGGNFDSGSSPTGSGITCRGKARITFDGYVFTGGAFISNGSSTGGEVTVLNSDLSALGSNPFINTGSGSSDNHYTIKLTSCKLPVITQLLETGQISEKLTVDMYQCTDFINGSDGMYFEYHYTFYGVSFTNTAAYLNYSYDGTNKASLKLESSTNTSVQHHSRFKLCELPAQDLATTDKTYRVNLLLDTATAATLTDSNFWVELSHNDNTDLALGKIVSSRNADILATGAELTASAETWLGTLPAGNKAYQVDITLNAASLSNVTNGNVIIYVNLAVPNCDVYADPAVQIGV